MTADASPAPYLRVVNPDATPEEVAAVVAVLSSLGGGAPPASRLVPSWSAPHRQVRRTLPHGPGGWRASSMPR
ncbi:acyl-CoA carboxylase subunit epsilon [Nocardioides dongkuii]|uniref:acyl-CoA carboxylase subunit epsilon n=1 Tax=Nocardioides dongkuii TaxID=2760089 RepID=UPI0015FAEAD3|nr:acyl-CoA carboxylase subunit epsilon [Nocardioides dongkuii]